MMILGAMLRVGPEWWRQKTVKASQHTCSAIFKKFLNFPERQSPYLPVRNSSTYFIGLV